MVVNGIAQVASPSEIASRRNCSLLSMVCTSPEDVQFLEIVNNNCEGFGIYKGDIVIVDNLRKPPPHGIALAQIGRDYKILPVSKLPQCKIVGSVTAVIHIFK